MRVRFHTEVKICYWSSSEMRSNSNVFAGLWGWGFTLKFDSGVWCKICYWRRLFEAISMKYSQNKSTKKHCQQMITKESSSWMEFIHVLMDIIWQGLNPSQNRLGRSNRISWCHDRLFNSLSTDIRKLLPEDPLSDKTVTWDFFDSVTWSFQAMTCQLIMTLWQLRDLSIKHDALAIVGDSLKFLWGDQQSLGFEKGDLFRPWKSCFSTTRKVGNTGPYPTHAAHGVTLVIVVT